MKNEYLLLIFLVFISCSLVPSTKEKQWETVKANGIAENSCPFDYLISPKEGRLLLLGSLCSDNDLIEKKFERFEAMLYWSDDSANSWRSSSFGNGRITAYACTRDTIILSKHEDSSENKKEKSTLYVSYDGGISWRIEYEIVDFFVRDIYISSTEKLFIIGKRSGDDFWQLRANDGGDVWKTVQTLPNDLLSPQWAEDYLYFRMSELSNYIIKFSLKNLTTERIDLSTFEGKVHIIKIQDGTIKIIGVLKGQIIVDEYKDQMLTRLYTIKENMFPVDFYSTNEQSVMLLGERNDVGVIYYIYSKDLSSKQWSKNEVPSSYFSPYLLKKDQVIGYSFDHIFYKLKI